MTDELQIPELDDIVVYSELSLILDNACNMFDSYIRMSSRKGSQYLLRAFTDWNSPKNSAQSQTHLRDSRNLKYCNRHTASLCFLRLPILRITHSK